MDVVDDIFYSASIDQPTMNTPFFNDAFPHNPHRRPAAPAPVPGASHGSQNLRRRGPLVGSVASKKVDVKPPIFMIYSIVRDIWIS